ncbi:MAG: magnesium transporter CorA family protein [Candidatus Kariarchaeaceae archaeon]|jgi:magnesium transporter
MPKSLIFDRNGIPSEIGSQVEINEDNEDVFIWTNLRVGDKIDLVLPDIVDRSESFTEDLVESQRPRIQVYQTLEDNDDTYNVIVLSFPTHSILDKDDSQIQVSFLFLENQLYTVGSKSTEFFEGLMKTALKKRESFTPVTFLVYIISELIEMSIKVAEKVEKVIDLNERKMLIGGLKQGWLTDLLHLKGRLYDTSRVIKADIEHIRELISNKVPNLYFEEIDNHVLDRTLHLLDLVEEQREDLSNMINLHLAIASNLMNRQFYWLAIIGSILVVPTVISSIWGMNLDDVPQINFWGMMLLIIGSTALASILVKILLPKPIIN